MNVLKRVYHNNNNNNNNSGGVYFVSDQIKKRSLGLLSSSYSNSNCYSRIHFSPTTRFYSSSSSSSRSLDDASLRHSHSHSHGFLLSRYTQLTPMSARNENWNTTTTRRSGLIHTTFRYKHKIANNENENSDVDIDKVEDHIHTLWNQNKIDEAFKVFSSHVTQNGATRLIRYCKNKGDENSHRLAMKVYRTLISSNITPSAQFFSNLLYLCNTVNQFDQTLTLLFDMEKYQIELDKHSFSRLTFATFKTNNKTIAQKLVDILKHGVDFQPLTKHCHPLLSTVENIDDSMWLMHFMLTNNIEIDRGCFIELFKACTSQGPLAYKHGQQIYDQLLKTPHSTNQEVLNHALQMFAKCGDINQAINVFETIEQPDFILWSCMIGLCAKNGEPYKSVELYDKMIENNITPTEITFTNILTAISNLGPDALKLGESIHQQIKQHKFDTNVILKNALRKMYDKCGEPNK